MSNESSIAEIPARQDEKPHYIGHRERLRQRLLDSKKGTLPDYEILELLLFPTRPRADVKPLAKSLIAEFGSLAGVISADPELLRRMPGIGDSIIAILRTVQEAAIRLVKEEMTEKPVIQSWKALLDYCRATMGHSKIEQFRILFLNKKLMIIADELQEVGTVDRAPVYPREVVKRALYHNAAAIIIVHNHPTGDTKPSRPDMDITKQIMQAASAVGIELHDHVIISNKSHYSFKSHGLI
jgi:DNA repair protein RadC